MTPTPSTNSIRERFGHRRCLAILWLSVLLVPSARAQWLLGEPLTASDAGWEDGFGWAVATDGEHILVGAPWDNAPSGDCGSVYVFAPDATGWVESEKIVPDDFVSSARFGMTLDFDHGVAVIGAPNDQVNGYRPGSAYIFELVDGLWTQAAKLTPPNADNNDNFAVSVGISQSVVVVGNHTDGDAASDGGAVSVYEYANGRWSFVQKVFASDNYGGQAFGYRVAVSGQRFIAAGRSPESGTALYVFEKSNGLWEEAAKLTVPDGAVGNNFGWELDLDGDTIAAGASLDDDAGNNAGAVYVLHHSGGAWQLQQKVLLADASGDDRLGDRVRLRADSLAAWSSRALGSCHLFRRQTGQWTEAARASAPTSMPDHFASSFDLADGMVAIGAYSNDDAGLDSGAAYVLRCASDFDDNHTVDTRDFIVFLNTWAAERLTDCSAGGCRADLNQDGVVDTQDFIAFLNAWAGGC